MDKNTQDINQEISSTHLEIGLYEVSRLMKNHLPSIPEAFQNIASNIDLNQTQSIVDRFFELLSPKDYNKVIISCGLEMELLDAIAEKFKHVVVIPNEAESNFGRIADNYSSHKHFKVLRPTTAADLVCPDTIILVPVYPLEDNTLLAYNYPCKLITKNVRSSSFGIYAFAMCKPLPLKYQYDISGLSKVLTPINPNYLSKYSTY